MPNEIERQLAFVDRFMLEIQEEVDTSISFPDSLPFVDQTTEIDLQVSWSQEQYTRILSALLTGADLMYPSLTQQIIYDFLKVVVKTVTCEEIADCIENDVLVQNALQSYLESTGHGSGSGTPNPSVYEENPDLIGESVIPDCDTDILFGCLTQLLDAINAQIEQFFELLEAESNGFERAAIVAEAIPGSDQAGFDTVASGFDQALEEISENYAANYTPELRDEYRCDLLCLIIDTCEIDFQTFADYFLGRVGASINTEDTFGDAVGWFISGTWIGTQIVDAAFGLVCTALAYAQDIFNMNTQWIIRGVAASLNDPDSDWIVLCDDCSPGQIEPIIEVLSCATSSGTCGTVDGQQTVNPNKWRVSSTHRGVGNDEGVVFRDTNNETFTITNYQTISGSSSVFSSYCNASGTLVNHGFGIPLNVPMKHILIVAANTQIFTADVTFGDL